MAPDSKQPTEEEIAALHAEFADVVVHEHAARDRRKLPWLIVAPWAICAFLRLFALDLGHPLIAAFAFIPWVAFTAFIPLIVTILLRARWPAVTAGVVILVFIMLLGGRSLPGPNPTANGSRVTVMTLNTYAGAVDERAVVDLVRNFRVDVLSLQELTPQAVDRLRDAGLEQELPFALDDSRASVYGAGIWSRHPLTRTHTQTNPKQSASPEAAFAGLGIRVRAVHPLPPVSSESANRWEKDLAALPAAATPDGSLRILAGDFNATLDHRALRGVINHGYTDAADATGNGLAGTWPTYGNITIAIDHVLADERIQLEKVRSMSVLGTDHRALIVQLRLP